MHHTDPLFQESLPDYFLYAEGDVPLLFTENETNNERLFGAPNASPYVKDGINNYVVNGQQAAVNPANTGTKAAPHYVLTVGPGETQVVRLRLTRTAPKEAGDPFAGFDAIVSERLQDADEFYDSITPPEVKADADRARVMRQALAGMLWTKQYFYYDVNTWLKEHQIGPESAPELRRRVRNAEWFHMYNDDIISMPDKWEYPWYAAWDLAFHTLALATVDRGLCQIAIGPDAPQRLFASERANARLRVEFWRRESARARVCHDADLSARQRAQSGQGRHRISQIRVRQAVDQLYLVGQPQGSFRQQCV